MQTFKDKFHNLSKPSQDNDPDFMDGILTASTPPPFEEGIVIKVYPANHTVDVETDNGTIAGCRIMTDQPNSSKLPGVGATCLVCTTLPIPTIMGYVRPPDATTTDADIGKSRAITTGASGFGGQDPTYRSNSDSNFRGGGDDSLMPGDSAMSSSSGSSVAALKGLALLKASETAQILASSLGNLVRIVSENFQHFHSAGFTEISKEGSAVNWKAEIGKTSRTGQVVNPLVKIYMGDSANGATIDIVDEDSSTVITVALNRSGEALVRADSLLIDTNENTTLEVGKDLAVSALGNCTLTSSKDMLVEGKNYTLNSNYASRFNSGGPTTFLSLGDMTHIVKGKAGFINTGETTGFYKSKASVFAEDDYIFTFGIGGTFGEFSMKKGDLKLTSTKSSLLGGATSTEIVGKSVLLGTSPAKYPVIRSVDLAQFAEDIVAYVNLTNTFTPTPTPKVVIPPGVGIQIAMTSSQIGSRIVRSA